MQQIVRFDMRFECNCERGFHEIPTETIEVSEHALLKIPEILKNYHRIYMVSDGNTYKAAGETVENLLKASGQLYRSLVLPVPTLPDELAIGRILLDAGDAADPYDINAFSEVPDYILAVGGGSINDACRMVAYRMHLPYGVAGTAPSMDGYASVVAPLLCKGAKTVFNCTIAKHIIIDLSVCLKAPEPLLLAGLGDMVGKYVAFLDWEIARDLTNEYYCEKIAGMVHEAADKVLNVSKKIRSRDSETVKAVIEGLLLSGECIAYAGTSRPASGTEHMIAQTWEIMDVQAGRVPYLHGIEVGTGTFESIEIFRKLYQETDDTRIHTLIEKYLPAFDALEDMQKTVKLPLTQTDRSVIIEGTLRGRTFRERYTVLQYLYDRGELERYAASAADSMMEKYYYGSFKEQFPEWKD